MPLPPDIEPLCTAWVRGLDAVLGNKLYGVYLYGALTFPEGGAGGDVDFHVFLTDGLSDDERAGLIDVHGELGRDFGRVGSDMDGYYLLLADGRQTTPPEHQFLPGVFDNAWALHRAHIHGGRYIALRGPDPRTIYPPATWPELEAALWGEVNWLEKHLTDYPDYGVLQLCRLMYTFQTRDVVVSKCFCAAWAEAAFPQWASLIDAARKSYDRGHPDADKEALAAQIMPFYRFVRERQLWPGPESA